MNTTTSNKNLHEHKKPSHLSVPVQSQQNNIAKDYLRNTGAELLYMFGNDYLKPVAHAGFQNLAIRTIRFFNDITVDTPSEEELIDEDTYSNESSEDKF